MKFALNTLVAAAALTATVAAHAVVTTNPGDHIVVSDPLGSGRQAHLTLVGGTAELVFSGGFYLPGNTDSIAGIIGALNVSRMAITGQGSTTVSETSIDDPLGDPGDKVRVGAEAHAGITSLVTGDHNGQILSARIADGVRFTGTRISGTLTGGTALLDNLRVDLVNKVVYADLKGSKSAVGSTPALNYDLPNTALWTIADISGPTAIPPEALLAADPVSALQTAGFTYLGQSNGQDTFSSVAVLSRLQLTQGGIDFLRNSLGLFRTGWSSILAANDDPQGWGTLTTTLTFAIPAVPEPSSYAMAGAGVLMAIGGGLRARRRPSSRA